ncbi:MAG: hypothetical protein ABI254_06535 [Chthoniobacterales bacterium]
MFRALGITLACVAMFTIAGGHWALFQTIAWARMLHDYSQQSTVVEAVNKTFDGQHPCAMCLQVKEGQAKEEKAPATVKLEKKAEIFAIACTSPLKLPISEKFSYPALAGLVFAAREEAPPQPVPKSFTV